MRADSTLSLCDGSLRGSSQRCCARSIRVESGLIVITREGDPEDHVLRAGEAVLLPPGGKVVAWALEAARATVQPAR